MKKLDERTIGVMVCTPCTLNCRLCGNCVPLFREKGTAYFCDVEGYKRDMLEAFRVYRHVETISLTGGEPLLHKGLPDIVAFSLRELPDKFGQLRITTNGTMLPDERLIRTIQTYAKDGNMLFVIDDYGAVSKKLPEVVEILEQNQIPYRINHYCGEGQHCGGWIDFGALDRFRGYSDEEAQHIVTHCHSAQWKCLTVFDGKLFPCNRAFCGATLGCFSLSPDEYIDLSGSTQSLDEKKRIAAGFGKKPVTACQYCDGFDVENSARFPAGEQLI